MVGFVVVGEELPWMTAILAQEQRQRDRPVIGLGHWTAEEWRGPVGAAAAAAAARQRQQRQDEQYHYHQQRREQRQEEQYNYHHQRHQQQQQEYYYYQQQQHHHQWQTFHQQQQQRTPEAETTVPAGRSEAEYQRQVGAIAAAAEVITAKAEAALARAEAAAANALAETAQLKLAALQTRIDGPKRADPEQWRLDQQRWEEMQQHLQELEQRCDTQELELQSQRGNRVASAAGGDAAHAREEQEILPQRQEPIPRVDESAQVLDGMQITPPSLASEESVLLDEEKGEKRDRGERCDKWMPEGATFPVVDSGRRVVLGREQHLVRDVEVMENMGQEEENGMYVGVAAKHQQQQLPLPPPKPGESGWGRDRGMRGVRRTRLGRIGGAGWRARVVGLGAEVQRHRRRCPFRSRLREKEKITIGLEGSLLGFPGLRKI